MAMANRLKRYLDGAGIEYELIPHDYTATSAQAARKAHVPVDQIAKAVVLEDGNGYMLAVLPGSRQLDLEKVRERCGRPVSLAMESDLNDLFADCASGAVPALGEAYDMATLWDERLSEFDDVFFEAGDHVDLVHVSGRDFRRLMGKSDHGRITRMV